MEKTIIDRCVRIVYRDYLNDPKPENMPLLEDLYNALRAQDEKEAQYIATALEIYVTGSLNVFNHHTNVDVNSRIVCYDIKKLGKQLNKIGMLVVQDQVWNRVTINRAAHKTTRYYVWGGSSPSTSFDCSGFVSWVINHSGWDAGKLGAQGLCNICTPVSSANVKPGFSGVFHRNLRYPRCQPCGHLRRQQYDDPLWRSDLLCKLKFKLLAVPFLPLWALAVKESERYEPENHEAPWEAGEEQRQNLRSARLQPRAGKAVRELEDTDIIGMVRENSMTMEQFAELFRRMQAAPAPATSEKEALNHD